MSIGGRPEFKADQNPAPGQYDPDTARELVSTRLRSAIIRESTSPYRRPKH
jgi:hypothetical protein